MIVCEHGWPAFQLDVEAAFLQGTIDDGPGHAATDAKTGVPMMLKTKHNLYGLFQSPILWHDTTDKVQLGIVFTPTLSDACVYSHNSIDAFAALSLLADDILITGRNKE